MRAGEFDKAVDLLTKAEISNDELALLLLKAGKTDDAIKKAADSVRSNEAEVRPLATQVEVLFGAGKKEEAKASFESLRKLSSTIDLDVPQMLRLAPIAAEFGFPADWRVAREMPKDLGARPDLDALGPFRWTPSSAPGWTLADVDDKPRTLANYRGRPVIVVFYLGYGCLHCAEQLQAMAKKFDAIKQAGFEVIAREYGQADKLEASLREFRRRFPIPSCG